MDIFLIKLILAHLIGDFFLQPSSWVKDKEQKKLKSTKLYLHIGIHVLLIFVLFFDLTTWKVALSIGILHLIIDAAKALLQTKKNARILFFIDQVLHFASIYLVWHFYYGGSFDLNGINTTSIWLILAGFLFLTMPTAIIMRVIIARWLPVNQPNNPQSLQNAGKYIGVLERILIFLFILTNHFEAVGFLLAAKSIFRFGDLKDAHDIKLTEYVLIGTLLSFGIAISLAIFVQKLLV